MDTELLVDDRIEEGRLLVERLIADGFDVSVAFWAKATEEGFWQFFIASSFFKNAEKPSNVYTAVYWALQAVGCRSDLTLLNDKEPIAQAAIELRDRLPARISTRYHVRRLGGLSVNEVYVYPKVTVPLRQSRQCVWQRFLANLTRWR